MELECAVQKYAWGKFGSQSAVANLSAASNESFLIDEESPFAELWMGTHPNGPSILKENKKSLKELIESDPKEILGEDCFNNFSGKLPYLFKILSVNKALSIQAHPDKTLAEKLHFEKPNIYKDDNHKPEMAIALTEFEGLCGFRPFHEIIKFISNIEELKNVLDKDATEKFISSSDENEESRILLKVIFTSLMTCDKEVIAKELKKLQNKIEEEKSPNDLNELFLRLISQYPGDVGCFVIYFLNHVRLVPGEAMFLGPNLPHAYLSGDCVECMACSDNVVRSGLTPKLIDVDTLCNMLEYKSSSNPKFQPVERNPYTLDYIAPVPDFSVSKLTVECKHSVSILPRSSASILIITQGSSKRYKNGTVLFIQANQVLELTNESETVDLIAYQAFC